MTHGAAITQSIFACSPPIVSAVPVWPFAYDDQQRNFRLGSVAPGLGVSTQSLSRNLFALTSSPSHPSRAICAGSCSHVGGRLLRDGTTAPCLLIAHSGFCCQCKEFAGQKDKLDMCSVCYKTHFLKEPPKKKQQRADIPACPQLRAFACDEKEKKWRFALKEDDLLDGEPLFDALAGSVRS